jgi:diacylglycerol O-acyltransferase / wax synthase
MSAQDASFLHIENDSTPMHVGGVSIFEGPPPPFEEFQAMIASKLPLVPRYRQTVRFVPGALSRPVWVDDQHFNLAYHVRRTALPQPGGDQELKTLTARVMSQNLDRAKPLWEIWVVEGLDDNRWALLSKVHHCMVDGVASTDLMAVLFDAEREPTNQLPADDWHPEPRPSDVQLVADALRDRLASNPAAAAEALAGAARAPREFAALIEQTASGIVRSAGIVRQPPASSLNGPLSPHRRWGWSRGRLSDVQLVRKAHGGTVNDVVLAAITGGFRELLQERGESTDRVLRTLVPVSVRRPGERGTYNNRVSAMFAELPVDEADPIDRLHRISEQMAGLKDSKQAVAGEVLTSLSGFAPPMLLALGARLASRLPQRSLNTGTTNVPGPQLPLYAAGRRLLESFPYIPLFAQVRVAVAIFSYDGGLYFGISGDYDSTPDIEVLCHGIERGLAQLVASSSPASSSEPAPAPPPAPAPAPAPEPTANGDDTASVESSTP